MWGTIFACLLFLIGAGLMVAVETQMIFDKRREAAIAGIILMAVGAVAAIYFINQNARGFEFERPKAKPGKGGERKDRDGSGGGGGGGGRRDRPGAEGEEGGGENALFGTVSKRGCPAKDNLVMLPQGFALLPIASATGQLATQSVGFTPAFCMSTFEVTVGEYRAFAEATKRAASPCDGKRDRTWRSPGFKQTDKHPVVCVTLDDATAYAAWKSEDGKVFRLPSESEWVYASGSGANASVMNPQKISVSSNQGSVDVAQGGVAPNGIIGVADNVSEMVLDCWRPELKSYPPSGAFAPPKGKCDEIVARGGHWADASGGGALLRRAVSMKEGNSTVGFRLARNTELGAAK